MEEQAEYIVKNVKNVDCANTDSGYIELALGMLKDAGITPRMLFVMANKCLSRAEEGFGNVTMVWVRGKPTLIIEEDRELWR